MNHPHLIIMAAVLVSLTVVALAAWRFLFVPVSRPADPEPAPASYEPAPVEQEPAYDWSPMAEYGPGRDQLPAWQYWGARWVEFDTWVLAQRRARAAYRQSMGLRAA